MRPVGGEPVFSVLLQRSGVPPRGPFDRSSLTRWRQRLGEEQIAALLQESLSVAHRTGAIESKDLERVVVDTTVQEKAIRIRLMRGSPTGRSRS